MENEIREVELWELNLLLRDLLGSALSCTVHTGMIHGFLLFFFILALRTLQSAKSFACRGCKLSECLF